MSRRDPRGQALQKARQEIKERDARIASMDLSHRLLQDLYDISKVLIRFQDIERTMPEALEIVSREISLRSTVLVIEGAADGPKSFAWGAQGESDDERDDAVARARATYAELTGGEIATGGREARTPDLATGLPGEPTESKLVTLPLVVEGGTIFGALQFEGAGGLDEESIVFLNALANQLAIAVDRRRIVEERQAATRAEEERQRFLGDVSAMMGAPLKPREVSAELVRLIVPFLADLCLIDELDEEGRGKGVEMLFADDDKQRDLAEQARALSAGRLEAYGRQVLASGAPLVLGSLTDPLAEGLARDARQAAFWRAAEVTSLVALPMPVRGKPLGVLTLAAVGSAGSDAAWDLPLIVELARRISVSLDNARLYQRALQATRDREELLAVVSHDLRSPLNLIGLHLEVMRQDPHGGGAERVDKIQRAADHMNRLIEDLLDAASIDAGKLSVDLRPVDVATLVADVLETLEPMASSKAVQLVSELPPDLPALHVDPVRIEQVLFNLLGNALKFTPEGGRITVGAEPSGGVVTFAVADDGPGMTEAQLPHLFDRFWMEKGRAGTGRGLGLFIARGIVQAHGGTIWAESEPAVGSRFYFTIPIAPASDEQGAGP